MVADRWLILAEQEYAEKVYDQIVAGEDWSEQVWETCEEIILENGDAFEDMTLKDIVRKTAEKIARKWSDSAECRERAKEMSDEA